MSGIPKRIRGTPSPGLFSQFPSIAAILAGWCLRVLSPCKSPMKSCSGAVQTIIHIAIENMVRIAALLRPCSSCQAAALPTMSAVERNAAVTMWVSR